MDPLLAATGITFGQRLVFTVKAASASIDRSQLMAEGLIAEYRLLSFPTILGTDEQFVPVSSPPAYLECVSAEQASATVLARYGRTAR